MDLEPLSQSGTWGVAVRPMALVIPRAIARDRTGRVMIRYGWTGWHALRRADAAMRAVVG